MLFFCKSKKFFISLSMEGLTLKEFKEKFRLICTDTWGEAKDAWFECAGHIYSKYGGAEIPPEWEYRPSPLIDGCTEVDSYWYELFANSSLEQLRAIGDFLFRYCQYLKFKEVDY